MDLPKTRAEAIARGLTRYFTGEPCKRGHIAERRVSTHVCVECSKVLQEIQKETKRAYDAARYRANPEKVRERVTEWRKANPEKAPRVQIKANGDSL